MKERALTLFKSHGFKLGVLALLVILSALLYQLIDASPKIFDYTMGIRAPKLAVMVFVAFLIGSATIVFQSLINNRIVTPCLLGMNSLYILIHTAVVFVLGSTSFLVTTKSIAFTIDLVIMGVAAILIYGLLFRKTGGNVLYVLLAGTVLATLFSSMSSALQRIMDPNEYETLLNALVAGFNRINLDVMLFSIAAAILIMLILRKELSVLNVLTLGKDQAINLGVDYDRTVQKLLIGVALFIAIATALVGPISFLGLIIANISRELFKTYRHSYLIFGSAFLGMIILLVGQALIEHVFEFNANISAFINIGGGIYFLYLLMRQKG